MRTLFGEKLPRFGGDRFGVWAMRLTRRFDLATTVGGGGLGWAVGDGGRIAPTTGVRACLSVWRGLLRTEGLGDALNAKI